MENFPGSTDYQNWSPCSCNKSEEDVHGQGSPGQLYAEASKDDRGCNTGGKTAGIYKPAGVRHIVQDKFRKDKPETTETGPQQGALGKAW